MNIDWDKEFEKGRDYSPFSTQQLDKFLQYTNSTKGNYLDIACGTGQLTREMFHRGYKSITGIDTSTAALTVARKATTQNITYLQVNLEEAFAYLFKTTFDLITCKDSVAFIQNLDSFLRQAATLLSQGGVFIIATPRVEAFPSKEHITINSDDLECALKKHFTIHAHYTEGFQREMYVLNSL